MEIETVESLSNQIADWVGIFGACKHDGSGEGCENSEKKLMCCRVGFTMILEERIRQAVENDKRLESAGF